MKMPQDIAAYYTPVSDGSLYEPPIPALAWQNINENNAPTVQSIQEFYADDGCCGFFKGELPC